MTDLKNISTICGCSKYGEPPVEAIDRGTGCCAERDEAATGTDDLGCCGQDCCGAEDEAGGDAGWSEIDVAALRRNLDIEFFYLDLSFASGARVQKWVSRTPLSRSHGSWRKLKKIRCR